MHQAAVDGGEDPASPSLVQARLNMTDCARRMWEAIHSAEGEPRARLVIGLSYALHPDDDQ